MKELLTFEKLQEEQREWSLRNFGPHDAIDPMLGLVEEVGELAHAMLKSKQGIRGTKEEHEAAAKDSVGDILVYLADFCTSSGWDMQQIIQDTWSAVKQRDWTKDKDLGGVATPSFMQQSQTAAEAMSKVSNKVQIVQGTQRWTVEGTRHEDSILFDLPEGLDQSKRFDYRPYTIDDIPMGWNTVEPQESGD